MRAWAWLGVTCVLVGCTAPSPTPVDPGTTLSDFLGCPIPDPDGQPIDCGLELETQTGKAPPQAWLCLAHFAQPYLDGTIDTTLWTDGMGRLGVWLQTETPSVNSPYKSWGGFQADVAVDGSWASAPPGKPLIGLYHVYREVFIEVPGTHADTGTWQVQLHLFSNWTISGQAQTLGAWWLSSQALEGGLWHWATFQSGHRFPVMAKGPTGAWSLGGLNATGQDFHLAMEHSLFLVGEFPYNARLGLPANPLDGQCPLPANAP